MNKKLDLYIYFFFGGVKYVVCGTSNSLLQCFCKVKFNVIVQGLISVRHSEYESGGVNFRPEQ